MQQNANSDRGAEIETLFATAMRLHQAGQIAQAEPLYRQILDIDPGHLGALNFLGVLAQASGDNWGAIQLLGRAITLDERIPDLHCNIAEAYRALGRLDEAIDHHQRALQLEPEYIEARCNLGNALLQKGKLTAAAAQFQQALQQDPNLIPAYSGLGSALYRQGKLEEAAASYRRALALNPNDAGACNNLAVTLSEQGDLSEAATLFARAVSLKPDFAEAHINLGNALREQGKLSEAVAQCRRALELRPDSVEALHNLGVALLMQGDAAKALGVVRRALGIRELPQTRGLFVRCAKALPSLTDPGLRPILLRAMTEPWGRPVDLTAACIQIVKANPAIQNSIRRVSAAWPLPFPPRPLFGPSDLSAIADDKLLQGLLETAPVCDLEVERLLTAVRLHLLEVAGTGTSSEAVDDATLALYGTLARQCFINEYVFSCTDAEAQVACKVRDKLEAALQSKAPISMLWVAATAAYFPLHSVAGAERLLGRSWPLTIRGVVDQQVREPGEERQHAAGLRRLTTIEDPISLRVRQQYEENPYPCWVKAAPADAHRMIAGYLRSQFPHVAIRDGANQYDVAILVAGCGTGQQSIEAAQQFPFARVTAVDLSLASLGYAQRKTRTAGVDNIEYAQADILGLASWDRRFDAIQASGVLHHLADWKLGWQTLLSLLRPGGFMRVGLYSKLARAEVAATREFIKQHGYPNTSDGIRRCRQELLTSSGTAMRTVTTSPDFFSTSACRDLLFHVQEHHLTLPEIAAFLDENRLQFLGFEIEPQIVDRYRSLFPDDRGATNLAHWHVYETQNPATFGSMYQFWLQRSGESAT